MADAKYKPIACRLVCWLALVAIWISGACSAATIVLDKKTSKVPLLGNADLAIDRSTKLVFGRNAGLVWKPADQVKSLSFGYSQAAYWLRFDVENAPSVVRYLMFIHPVLDDVTLQCIDPDGKVLSHEQQGDGFAFAGRDIPLSLISFRLPDATKYHCTARIVTTSTVLLDAYVVDGVGLASSIAVEYLKMGATNAAVLAIAVFLLASNAFRRSALLPAYAVASISIALWNATNSGIGQHVFWPHAVWWQNNGAPISGTLAYAGISAYVWLILRRKKELKRVAYIPAVALVVWLVVCLATFVQKQYPSVLELYAPLGFVHALIMVGVMVYASLRQRDVGLYILTAGQISFATTSTLVAALMAGILPPWPWLRSLLPYGFVSELFFLALSLAYESEQVRRELHTTRRSQIEDAKRAEERQEAAIEQRTGEISNIVEAAIHDVVSPLHLLTDTLSYMDEHISEQLRPELRACIEMVSRLGIIASNIHAFERYKDGHEVTRAPTICRVNVGWMLRRHVYHARLSMGGRVCIVADNERLIALCDEHEIGRLIDNLLSNFWRHTPRRSSLLISYEAAGDTAVIRFDDDGNGMMALQHKMDAYAAGTMKRGKVGGLYNSFRYARRSGGSLRYENSTIMGGACFVLTLPGDPEGAV